jgi:hypothetical protein
MEEENNNNSTTDNNANVSELSEWISKKSNWLGTWRKRYMTLQGNNLYIKKSISESPHIHIILTEYMLAKNTNQKEIKLISEKSFKFNISIICESEDSAEKWKSLLGERCFYYGDINQENDRNGYGIFRWFENNMLIGMYEGEWRQNKQHGSGVHRSYKDGKIEWEYSGDWIRGHKEGFGSFIYPNTENGYVGQFKNDKKNGRGKHKLWGTVYDGEFCNDQREGYGVYTMTSNGLEIQYKGQWMNNKMHGQGTMVYQISSDDDNTTSIIYNDNKFQSYDGAFLNDQRCGYGTMTYLNGDIYRGEWSADIKYGAGIYTDHEGNVFDGCWNDFRMNGKVQYTDGSTFEGTIEDFSPVEKKEGSVSSDDVLITIEHDNATLSEKVFNNGKSSPRDGVDCCLSGLILDDIEGVIRQVTFVVEDEFVQSDEYIISQHDTKHLLSDMNNDDNISSSSYSYHHKNLISKSVGNGVIIDI